MKKFVLYDANSAEDVDQALKNLIRMFDNLEEIAGEVDYHDDGDRETYKGYVKSLREYFSATEKRLLREKDKQ